MLPALSVNRRARAPDWPILRATDPIFPNSMSRLVLVLGSSHQQDLALPRHSRAISCVAADKDHMTLDGANRPRPTSNIARLAELLRGKTSSPPCRGNNVLLRTRRRVLERTHPTGFFRGGIGRAGHAGRQAGRSMSHLTVSQTDSVACAGYPPNRAHTSFSSELRVES